MTNKFGEKIDIDAKLSSLNKRVTTNKTKHLLKMN